MNNELIEKLANDRLEEIAQEHTCLEFEAEELMELLNEDDEEDEDIEIMINNQKKLTPEQVKEAIDHLNKVLDKHL